MNRIKALTPEQMRQLQTLEVPVNNASMMWIMLPSGDVLTTNTDDHRMWAEKKGYNYCPAFTSGDVLKMIPDSIPAGDEEDGENLRLYLKIGVTWKQRIWEASYYGGKAGNENVARAWDFETLIFAMLRWFVRKCKTDYLKKL